MLSGFNVYGYVFIKGKKTNDNKPFLYISKIVDVIDSGILDRYKNKLYFGNLDKSVLYGIKKNRDGSIAPKKVPKINDKFWSDNLGINGNRIILKSDKTPFYKDTIKIKSFNQLIRDNSTAILNLIDVRIPINEKIKMKNLKSISEYINENYPAGAENDPNRPWKDTDTRDTPRAYTNINSDYELVASDMVEFAIFSKNDRLYLLHFETDSPEMKPFMRGSETYTGRDEDGNKEYDSNDDEELTDEGLTAYANSIFASNKNIGIGMLAFDRGDDIVEIDSELREDLIDTFTRFQKSQDNKSYGSKISYKRILDVLKN